LEEIWSKIKHAREVNMEEDHEISEWDAVDIGEEGLVLFSKEHLRYSFALAFQQWETNGMEDEVPIVWYTRPSSLKIEIGTYCLCSISRHRIRGVPQTNDGIRHALLDINCELTKDTFFLKMNTAGSVVGCGIFQLILHRLLGHFVYHGYNGERKVSPTKKNLTDHMEGIQLGENSLELLFGTKFAAFEYVNNHVCKVTKAELMYYDHLSDQGYVNHKRGKDHMSVLRVTNKAFRGVLPQVLRRVLVERTTKDHIPPADQVNFPFYDDDDTPGVNDVNILAANDGHHFIYSALKLACEKGVLTQSLLMKLLEFRLEFNKNREIFQQGLLKTPDWSKQHLNSKLLTDAGFGCDAVMAMKPRRDNG
jgi:hypothetical protein